MSKYIYIAGKYEGGFKYFGIEGRVVTEQVKKGNKTLGTEDEIQSILVVSDEAYQVLVEKQGRDSSDNGTPESAVISWGLISEEIEEKFSTNKIRVSGVELFVDNKHVYDRYAEMVKDGYEVSDLIECESLLDFISEYTGCSYYYNIGYMLASLVKMNGGNVEAFFNKFKLAN